jgi:hypothetical protein
LQLSNVNSANNSVSDTSADLKYFIHVKKIFEPIKSELDEHLADVFDEVSLDNDFDKLT